MQYRLLQMRLNPYVLNHEGAVYGIRNLLLYGIEPSMRYSSLNRDSDITFI